MRKTIYLILSIVVLFSIVGTAAAQTYIQPMYEVHWTTRTLLISIPTTSTPYEQSAFTNSISYWNKAETWFVQSYYPKDYPQDIFTLQLASQGQFAQVTVQYVSSLTASNGVPVGGETTNYGTRIVLVINSGLYPFSGLTVEHELGHVLGLDDNSIPTDLMYYPPNPAASTAERADFPSTLDLYAVFVEAKCLCYVNGDMVTLPENIAYVSEAWTPWHPPIVIPEFSLTQLMSIIALLSTFIVLRRLRISNPRLDDLSSETPKIRR